MLILTVTFWAGGHLRRRWQFWVGETPEPPLVWAERPLWHSLKLIAVALAIMATLPTLVFMIAAGLMGGPNFEFIVISYFYSIGIVAPSFLTCSLGLVLADWLVVAYVRPAAVARERQGRTARGVFLCAIYLFVLFDVVLLLPRSFIALSGSNKAIADYLVAASAPLLIAWATFMWLRARRRPRAPGP
jgi:hypothetical protein